MIDVDSARHHFLLLTRNEQANAIKRMASQGWSEYGIAYATRLSVEQIRRVLSERTEASAQTGALVQEPSA